jgi:GTP:adenosylcobinamide-phosphate guanylyltransferase
MTTNTYLDIIITKFTESYKKGNEIYNIRYNGKSDTPYRKDYDVFVLLLGVTIKAKIRIKKFVKVDENGTIIGTNPITDFKNVEFLLYNTNEWVNAETGESLYSPTDKIKGNKEKFLKNIPTINSKKILERL